MQLLVKSQITIGSPNCSLSIQMVGWNVSVCDVQKIIIIRFLDCVNIRTSEVGSFQIPLEAQDAIFFSKEGLKIFINFQ
jgi:hypothetical protein